MVALGGGVLLPNFLRWYWWRFNGWGYTVGIVASVVAAAIQVFFFPKAPDYYVFPVFFAIGLGSSVVATLVTEPPKKEVLVEFYRKTRPAGFWKPVYRIVLEEDESFSRGTPFSLQLLNTGIAGVGIIALYLFPIYLVLKKWDSMIAALGVLLCCIVVMVFTWYKPLKENPTTI